MTRTRPLVSIGMPVFNGARHIRDALDSLLAQTYASFELIISDNASTDRTEEICLEYAARDSRIRYVRQPINQGASANFKFVLNEAAGEFFMWAAYDDYWKPNFITHALSIMMNDESIGFVFPSTILKSIHLHIFKKIPKDIFKGIEDKNPNRRILTFANLHPHSHKGNLVYSVFRTNVLRNALSIQDIFPYEFLFCMILLRETRGIVMDEYYFYKRYPLRWPGFRKKASVRPEKQVLFEKGLEEYTKTAKHLFPEIGPVFELIRLNHRPAIYYGQYEIVKDLFHSISIPV